MFCEVFSPGPCSLRFACNLARFARCGRFTAAAAASRQEAAAGHKCTDIIEFVVRGLTFANVIALGQHKTC